MRARLLEDIGQIYTADLPVAHDPTLCATDEVLDRLQRIEEQSAELRAEALRDGDESADPGGASRVDVDDVLSSDLEALARTPLFRAKRARSLRALLRAHRQLDGVATLRQAISGPDGGWAVQLALRQLKKRFLAAAMMEITVCGAVPPYNHLLAGKLACLLMASPRIVKD